MSVMDMRILVEQNVGERLKKRGLAQEEFASFRDSVSNISTDFVPQVFLRRQRLMSQPWQPSGTVQRDLGARKFEQ
jgi:hypothetical protein